MKDRKEAGMVAIWSALTFLFIVGSVALAADSSGFFQSARVDQTTADLACLAGVQELPGSPSIALTVASENVKANFPRVAGATPVVAGNQATMTVGGNIVVINTNWTSDPKKMRVQVTSSEPRTFSRIWGSSDIPVRQEAVCVAVPAPGGPGMLPVAALPGAFSGDLFDCAAKVTGNCGAVDSGSGGSDWRTALENGLDGKFEKHHGNWATADVQTGRAGTVCSSGNIQVGCNAIDTETGNIVGPFNQGMANRLSNVADADCIQGGDFNCDSLAQVIGATAGTLADAFGNSAPSWWQTSIYGNYSSQKNKQYYYDGDVEKCDSPRLAAVPIMNFSSGSGVPNHWNIGSGAGTWPNGKKTMKIIGFYNIYIREPDNRSDVGNGNGNGLNQIVADVIWFGPNATCDGEPAQFFGGPPVTGSIKLVAS